MADWRKCGGLAGLNCLQVPSIAFFFFRFTFHVTRFTIFLSPPLLFALLPFSPFEPFLALFLFFRFTFHVSRYSLLRPYLLESSYKFSFTRFINSDIREFGNYRITSKRLLFQPLRTLQPPIGQNRPRQALSDQNCHHHTSPGSIYCSQYPI